MFGNGRRKAKGDTTPRLRGKATWEGYLAQGSRSRQRGTDAKRCNQAQWRAGAGAVQARFRDTGPSAIVF
jgi:hypothetical protein